MKRNYKLVNQEPNECVFAVLQMLCERNGYDLSSKSMDEWLSNFKRSDPNGENKGKGEYICIQDLNSQFFRPFHIQLLETYINFRYIDDWDDDFTGFIRKFKESDNDIIVFANYARVMYGEKGSKEEFKDNLKALEVKHCFLVSDIDEDNNIYLVCPEVETKGGTNIIKTTTKKLYDGMNLSNSSGLGYSIITKRK